MIGNEKERRGEKRKMKSVKKEGEEK